MGDMADFTNEQGEDEYEHYLNFRDAPLSVQYEEGLVDEQGRSYFHDPPIKKKPSGPGGCPICRGPTELKEGKFGKFYGCKGFPDCTGSRNFK